MYCMNLEELKTTITGLLPSAIFEETGEWLNINIEPNDWLSFAQQLRNTESLYFDYPFCLTCIDWKTHLTMVYHLSSTKHRHNIVIKSKLDRNKPVIETVCKIWRTAELHEREVFEMFGVNFLNHPDLRRILMPYDWEAGYPLRKDYANPEFYHGMKVPY